MEIRRSVRFHLPREAISVNIIKVGVSATVPPIINFLWAALNCFQAFGKSWGSRLVVNFSLVCKLIMIWEIWLAQEADFVHVRAVKGNRYEEASKAVSRSALWLTAVSARLVVGLDWVLWLGPLCPCVKEIDKNYTSCHFQTPLKSSVCEHPSVFVYFVFYILSLHFPGALAPLSESVCVCMY